MNMIASDTAGENHQFGVTVQHLCADDNPALLTSKIDFIVRKLAQKQRQFCAEESDEDGVPSCTIPMPIVKSATSTDADCATTALIALGLLARELRNNGMRVLNVIPTCLSNIDPDANNGSTTTIGFRVATALEENCQPIFDRYDEQGMERTWCEQAFEVYGDAAIRQLKAHYQQQAALNATPTDNPQ